MKKAKIFALSFAMLMLLSAFVIPTSAEESSMKFHFTDATFTADGVKGTDEGWSETPIVVLDSQGAEGAPEVYASTDGEYLYIFFDAKGKIIHEAFLFVQLGTENKNSNANGKDKFVYPRIKVKCSGNDQVTCGSYNYLTTGKTDGAAFSGITWGESADFTAVEFKIPIPDDFKSKLVEDDQEIKLGCLIREWNPDGTDSNDVNNYKKEYKNSTYGFDWTNAMIPVSISKAEVVYEIDNTCAITNSFTLDGKVTEGEIWADKPFAILDVLGDTTLENSDVAKIYISTDRENIYVFVTAPYKIQQTYLFLQLDGCGIAKDTNKNTDGNDKFLYAICYGTAKGDGTATQLRRNGAQSYTTDYAFGNTVCQYNDAKTAVEIKVPLPENLKSQLASGDVKFASSIFVRQSNEAGDNVNISQNTSSTMTIDAAWGKYGGSITIPKAPSNSNIVVEGLQDRVEADGLTDVRFLASLKGDYQDYEALGFEFGYQEHNATADCKYVYTSIKAGDDLVTPDLYEADYFFCYTIYNLSAGDYTFTVRSWSQKEGESKSYSDAAVFDITVNQDGSVIAK